MIGMTTIGHIKRLKSWREVGRGSLTHQEVFTFPIVVQESTVSFYSIYKHPQVFIRLCMNTKMSIIESVEIKRRTHHMISRISPSPKASVISIYAYSPQGGAILTMGEIKSAEIKVGEYKIGLTKDLTLLIGITKGYNDVQSIDKSI
jgi:hypothetical protein